MKFLFFAFAAFFVFSQVAHAAPKLSADDKAWIETCARRLTGIEKKTPTSARIYCTCMHEMVENNEDMSQSDLEHSWPPMHISCRKKAGWHREKTR
jgi:hypothetical protein